MLNLIKLSAKYKKKNKSAELEKSIKYTKDFPASIREWNNSIYVFNKNTLSFIPKASEIAIKIIKSYFSLYNFKLERKIRINRLLRRFRRISSHKIYVSNGEFKHSNDKVIITFYTYNRQKANLLLKIKKKYLKLFKKNKNKLYRRFYLIKDRGLKYLIRAYKNKNILIRALNIKYRIKNKKCLNKYKNLYTNQQLIKFYKKIVKKALRKLKLYLYYKQLLFINESKFNYTYLQVLKNYLEKLYNKNIEFKIVNLKYLYLNSDILSETLKLKINKNRRKLLRNLKRLTQKVKISKLDKSSYYEAVLNESVLGLAGNKNPIEQLLENKPNIQNELLKKVILQDIKYKRVSGVRLEASGRLTRRYTASRSVTKIRYTGNLINADSTYKGLSTVILKGNLRSNLQFSKTKSKTRIGSFGIKGWVSGS